MKKINISVLLLAVCILFSYAACKVKKDAAFPRKGKAALDERRQSMKDYALCSCLSHIATNDTAVKNDISISVYYDLTGYHEDLYTKVKMMADSAFRAIKPAQLADFNGRKAYMMDCIEFSRSKRLDSLIRSHDADIKEK